MKNKIFNDHYKWVQHTRQKPETYTTNYPLILVQSTRNCPWRGLDWYRQTYQKCAWWSMVRAKLMVIRIIRTQKNTQMVVMSSIEWIGQNMPMFAGVDSMVNSDQEMAWLVGLTLSNWELQRQNSIEKRKQPGAQRSWGTSYGAVCREGPKKIQLS